MKRRLVTVWMMLSVMSLSGCSFGNVNLSKVQESTIGVDADGTIKEMSIEPFTESYYSLEALESFVDQQISIFNEEHPQPAKEGTEPEAAIEKLSIAVEGEKASLYLQYLSDDYYNQFNGTELSVMSYDEAVVDYGQIKLLNVKDSGESLLSEVPANDKMKVISTTSSMRIQTAGKILYYSQDVSLIDAHTVQTADGVSMIVYK